MNEILLEKYESKDGTVFKAVRKAGKLVAICNGVSYFCIDEDTACRIVLEKYKSHRQVLNTETILGTD